jgi:Transglutaminase-like superfamily
VRRPPTPREALGAFWALRAVCSARRQLRSTGHAGIVLPPVPRRPEAAARGVRVVLRRLPATCLERAVILQRWRAAQGDPHDVVVGVLGPGEGFRAHAWLDDEEPVLVDGEQYRELLRIRP